MIVLTIYMALISNGKGAKGIKKALVQTRTFTTENDTILGPKDIFVSVFISN